MTVRLIKGAYWDYEVAQAELLGWPAPVWTDKSDTDACFERMTETLVDAMPRSAGEGGVKLAIGSHNNVEYKLTGGVFSRKPSHLELARREFRVGNLYLNRSITGAIVGRQPFGGFGLSGTGTKAGGEDYLLHFVEPRACSENTLRHGFAPGIEGDA